MVPRWFDGSGWWLLVRTALCVLALAVVQAKVARRCGSFHGFRCGANMVVAEWRWLVCCCRCGAARSVMVVREEEDGGARFVVAALLQSRWRRDDGGAAAAMVVEGEKKIRVRVLGDEDDDVAESDWLIW